MPDYAYVPFVLTNHAKERMQLRGITTQMIAQALAKPNSTQPGRDGDTKYILFLGGSHPVSGSRELHVIAFFNAHQKKWIIKSVWVRGENDSLILMLYQSLSRWLGRLFKS